MLIIFGFLSFFIAHSLFWYLGIFNSMGLGRVMIGVMPLIVIIVLHGYNLTTGIITHKMIKKSFQITFLLYIIIFPVTSNPAAINWERDMKITADQKSAMEIAEYLKAHNIEVNRFFYAPPYLSDILHIDHFDPEQRLNLTLENLNKLRKNDIVIWDNWLTVVDNHLTIKDLESIPDLIKLKEFRKKNINRESVLIVYVKK